MLRQPGNSGERWRFTQRVERFALPDWWMRTVDNIIIIISFPFKDTHHSSLNTHETKGRVL